LSPGLFPPKEPVLDFLNAILELGDNLQDLTDGLFGGEVSSRPLAEERFKGIGAQVNLLSHELV
jgi:hypothetical protein